MAAAIKQIELFDWAVVERLAARSIEQRAESHRQRCCRRRLP
jgi:hypothetical protein